MDTEVDEIVDLAKYSSIESFISQKIKSIDLDDYKQCERPFYVADMIDVYEKLRLWRELMPNIEPFYAVKCNNLPQIVRFLAALGANFDCASRQEIEQVIGLGIDPRRIIYANPCKSKSYIEFAKLKGVKMMTFDNELELHKIAKLYPQAELLIRIKGDEASSDYKLNVKFGADVEKAPELLELAKELNLRVIGVAFHNGSGCRDAQAYYQSIKQCRIVFDAARKFGFELRILDIGGGFPGERSAMGQFRLMCAEVQRGLADFFANEPGLKIIAEPGAYFVASALTLVTMVTSKRVELDEASGCRKINYYLNDGIYGGLSEVLFNVDLPAPKPLSVAIEPTGEHQQQKQQQNQQKGNGPLCKSVFWGPTCDSIDCIKRDFLYPELEVGDWLIWYNRGAYTLTITTQFNSFDQAYVIVGDNFEHLSGGYLRNSIELARRNMSKLCEAEQKAALTLRPLIPTGRFGNGCALADFSSSRTPKNDSRRSSSALMEQNK